MNYQNDSIRRQDRLLDQPEATELLRRGACSVPKAAATECP